MVFVLPRVFAPGKSEVTIFIKTLTGETHIIRAFPSETVLDIKEKSERAGGISVDQQRLIHAGKQLEDGLTLRHYNIQNGYTLHMFLPTLSGRKPVILLYPPAPVDTTVTLELSPFWSFSALYPKSPSSKLQQAAQDPKVSLLTVPFGTSRKQNQTRFYEFSVWGNSSYFLLIDARPSGETPTPHDRLHTFCFAPSTHPHSTCPVVKLVSRLSWPVTSSAFLEGALERLGLNMRERCDMVTYWLPLLEPSAFNVIYFVNVERFEKAARLTIAPAPDVTIRVFMAFR
ncbi:unnamed protein product [Ectocarpus sp. 6 AP-2014]